MGNIFHLFTPKNEGVNSSQPTQNVNGDVCEFEDSYNTSCIVDARSSFDLGREHILFHRDKMRSRIEELLIFLTEFKKNSKQYLAVNKELCIGNASYISLSLYKVNLPSKHLGVNDEIEIDKILSIFKNSWRKAYFEELERTLLEDIQIADSYLPKLSKPRKALIRKSQNSFSKEVANHINAHLGEYLFDVILSDNFTRNHIFEDFPDSHRDHFKFKDNWKLESQFFDGIQDYGFDDERLGSVVNDAFCQSLKNISGRMLSIKKRISRNSHRHLVDSVLKKGSAAHDCSEGLALFSSAIIKAEF